MKLPTKQALLHFAEVFDVFRVVPRAFFAAYFLWFVWTSDRILYWYMNLPRESRGLEASGFCAVFFTASIGFLKQIFDVYSRNGRDWTGAQTTTEVASVATTTTTPKTP